MAQPAATTATGFVVARRNRQSDTYQPAHDLIQKRDARDQAHAAADKATRALNRAALRAHETGGLTWEHIGRILKVTDARARAIARPRTGTPKKPKGQK